MIDYVPPADVAHLEKNPRVKVFKRTSNRIIYFCPDVRRDKALFITDKEGRPLEKNPLKDLRVRKAISMAINRDAICKHVMEGLASPASQLIPEGFATYNPTIKVEKFDPIHAKKLLAEAGYPNGFGLTVHGPNDRYVNDAKVCQAVGQMLAQIGLAIKVDTMPKGVFFPKITAPSGELSFFLVGIGTLTGDSSWNLTSLLHTYHKAKGVGGFNQGGYSNPELDHLLDQANSTIDDAQREKLLLKAMDMAVSDLGVIPLHAQFTMSATRKGLITPVRADEMTLVMDVKPAP
jgi:peptide/nickel transport system substrate-binding protein